MGVYSGSECLSVSSRLRLRQSSMPKDQSLRIAEGSRLEIAAMRVKFSLLPAPCSAGSQHGCIQSSRPSEAALEQEKRKGAAFTKIGGNNKSVRQ